MFFINDYKNVLNTSIVTLIKGSNLMRKDDLVFSIVFDDYVAKNITYYNLFLYTEKGGVSEENILNCFKEYKEGGILNFELGYEDDRKIKQIIFHRLNGQDCNIILEF